MHCDLAVEPGEVVPDFRLPGADAAGIGSYRLRDVPDESVLVGISNSIPRSGWTKPPEWIAALERLDRREALGVVLVALGANNVREVCVPATDLGMPVLADAQRRVGRAFGVAPDDPDVVVLLDGERCLVDAAQVGVTGPNGEQAPSKRSRVRRDRINRS